jgi:preprotein translocase subunit YajC
MSDLISSLVILAEGEAQQGPNIFSTLLMFLPLLLLWIFLIEGPRRKQAKVRDELLKNLKKNDRVVTAGGIIGVVTYIQSDSNEVTVRVDDANNTRLRVLRSSIERVLDEAEAESSESKDSK